MVYRILSINLSDESKEKIAEELKWRYNFENEDIMDIIDKVLSYINEIDKVINPEKLEPTVQTILKYVFDEVKLKHMEKKHKKGEL